MARAVSEHTDSEGNIDWKEIHRAIRFDGAYAEIYHRIRPTFEGFNMDKQLTKLWTRMNGNVPRRGPIGAPGSAPKPRKAAAPKAPKAPKVSKAGVRKPRKAAAPVEALLLPDSGAFGSPFLAAPVEPIFTDSEVARCLYFASNGVPLAMSTTQQATLAHAHSQPASLAQPSYSQPFSFGMDWLLPECAAVEDASEAPAPLIGVPPSEADMDFMWNNTASQSFMEELLRGHGVEHRNAMD